MAVRTALTAQFGIISKTAGTSRQIQFSLNASQGLIGRDTENSYPQSHPQPLLYTPGFESHGLEKLLPSRNHLVEVFVRVQIESRLNPRMSQDSR
jgi:hypothetical protein